jgi:hypothetical protein
LLEKAKDIQDDEDVVAPDANDDADVEEATLVVASGGLLARADSTRSTGQGSSLLSSSARKGVAGGLAGLLILFIAYQVVMGFSLGEYSVSVSAVEIDESDDTLRVQMFIGTPMLGGTPDDPLEVRITYGGVEAYNGSFTPKNKLSWYEIPFSEFYQGNSRAAASDLTDIDYTIEVRQGGSVASAYPISPEIMDRTITAVDGELATLTEATTCDEETGECPKNGLDHLGASLRVGAGVEDPVTGNTTGPVTGNTTGMMLHVDSDYTIQASINFEGSEVFVFPTVTVDGSTATWSGGGGLVESAWLDLDGDGEKLGAFNEMQNYIPRGDFYDGDGCYIIEITVTHESPFGDVFTANADQGFQFWWDYNENRDTGNEFGDPEPYKPTEAC